MKRPDRAQAIVKILRASGGSSSKMTSVQATPALATLEIPRRCPPRLASLSLKFAITSLAAAFVVAIISIGRNLNLPVVAEGVETAEKLEPLRRIGRLHHSLKEEGVWTAEYRSLEEARASIMYLDLRVQSLPISLRTPRSRPARGHLGFRRSSKNRGPDYLN
jgi:hypothetical protein